MNAPSNFDPNQPTVVQKYGGSSLADPAAIQRVADTVVERVQQGNKLVVVVSAMGGSTNALIELAGQISEHPKRRELDMLLSTGERVTMALLSMAIADRGIEAISFTGSQCGIITNDVHTDARIIDVRPVRVEDELARGRVVIVAGFQGMSYTREITTLGRGGSDTTALALAAALGADHCEIYSDVEGVFSADPRCVRDAKLLDQIGFGTLETLARGGAKVLHADAAAWARRAGIAFRARKTGSQETGTLVGVAGLEGIVAVSSSDQRRFLQPEHPLDGLHGCIVYSSDQGTVIDSQNLHGELPGIACKTLTAAGEDLLCDPKNLSQFLACVAPCQGWWATPFGLHARFDEHTDIAELTRRAHATLVV